MMLPLFSAAFAAFALLLYVVLDGFDLGVGMLLLFEPTRASRDHMIDSITPTWDGNETWLIMAGVTLLAGFPIAYGILMPALYLPVIVMLLALGLRGVSFEFRAQMKEYRPHWDIVFAVGSTVAAFMQGLILGTLLQGVQTNELRFTGSVLDVFHPLPVLSGITLMFGYMVLGSGWLQLKARMMLQGFAARMIRIASIGFGAFFCFSCICAWKVQPGVPTAWSAYPVSLSMLTSLFLVLSVCLIAISRKNRPLLAFLIGFIQFAAGMAGLAIIIYPNIVPFHVSLWDAAASPTSQTFLLVGAAIVAPMVIAYSAFAYWVFRGRTPAGGWEE
jgi:cytochrome d ubiquinol oxidase subunit II